MLCDCVGFAASGVTTRHFVSYFLFASGVSKMQSLFARSLIWQSARSLVAGSLSHPHSPRVAQLHSTPCQTQ